jgi:hypothetical protein
MKYGDERSPSANVEKRRIRRLAWTNLMSDSGERVEIHENRGRASMLAIRVKVAIAVMVSMVRQWHEA